MTLNELHELIIGATEAVYYPYRTARVAAFDHGDDGVEMEDILQYYKMLRYLRALSGDKAANDNHCVFLLTTEGGSCSLSFSDNIVCRGREVKVRRW